MANGNEKNSNEKNEGENHDHIERDIIRISPSVLECRLRELERYSGAKVSILQDLALLLTIYVPLASGGLKDFLGVSASYIGGAFVLGLIIMIAKTVIDVATVVFDNGKTGRTALMRFLKKEHPLRPWWQFLDRFTKKDSE